MRSDDGKATIELQHLSTQANGSSAWVTATDAQGAISQGNAGWDDAIPWKAGTYDLTYAGAFAGAADSWRVSDTDPGTRKVAGRDGIRLHQGSQASPSQALEGCIGATASFLARAHAALSAAGEVGATTRIPMEVSDSGGSFFPLGITETVTKSTLDPGDTTTLTLSLTGGGSADGVTKNIFFHIGATRNGQGSTASLGSDYSITSSNGGKVVDSAGGSHAGASWPAGEYLELPKGQSSVTYTITDKYKDTTAGAKTADLTVDNYYVERVLNGTTQYSDHASPKILLQGSSIGRSIVTLNGQTQLPQQVSGDIQGLHRTYSVVKGDTINYDFQAYTIPDLLSISDGVSTYGTGGFVSDDHQGSFVAGSNQIQVNVVGSTDGTAWDLGLTETPAASAKAQSNTVTAAQLTAPVKATSARAATAAVAMAASTLAAAAAPSGATLSLVSSSSVAVPASGTTSRVSFSATSGKQYLARVVGAGSQTVMGDSLNVYEGGAAQPFLTSSDSSLAFSPAASFSVDRNETVDLTVANAAGNAAGTATVQVYDASAVTSPLLYFENDPTDQAIQGSDQGIAIHLHRLGDLSQAATYTLLVQPDGTSPITAADLGGSLSVPITFAAGDDVATAVLNPVSNPGLTGQKTATVVLDPTSVTAETTANDQLLNLQSSVAIAIDGGKAGTEHATPVITSTDASSSNGDNSVTFNVHLSQAATDAVYLSYATIDQSAVAGQDYTNTNGILTFTPGQTDATITVPILKNTTTGADKTFGLNLISPFNASFPSGSSLLSDTGTIKENGGKPQHGLLLTVDPAADFAGYGTFTITGTTAAVPDATGVEISAMVDGTQTDLGAATLNSDGTFSFDDYVGRHTQTAITAAATNGVSPDTSVAVPFSLQAGIVGVPYVAEEDSYASDGSVTKATLFHRDFSRTVFVETSNQTLTSTSSDTFINQGQPDNVFVFNPGFAGDVIRQFRALGPDHDTISLQGDDFDNSIAEVLRNTHNAGGGNGAIITDPTTGDTIRLAGMSKAVLRANQADIAFHA